MANSSDSRVRTIADGNTAAASVAYRCNELCSIYPIAPSAPVAATAAEGAAAGRRPGVGAGRRGRAVQRGLGHGTEERRAGHGCRRDGALVERGVHASSLVGRLGPRYRSSV